MSSEAVRGIPQPLSSRARRQRGGSRACWKCRRLSEKTACCGRNRRGRAGERRVAPRLDPHAARAHAGDSTGFTCPASLHPRAPDSARGPGRGRLLSSSHRCTVAPKPARWRAGRWQWVAALPTRRPPAQPSPGTPRNLTWCIDHCGWTTGGIEGHYLILSCSEKPEANLWFRSLRDAPRKCQE